MRRVRRTGGPRGPAMALCHAAIAPITSAGTAVIGPPAHAAHPAPESSRPHSGAGVVSGAILGGDMVDYATARMNMVESQLRTNRVTNLRLLDAFENVPRERFVPESLKSIAYVDEDLRVKDDRYLMEPMVLARLLNDGAPTSTDVMLIVGCLTGYACAIAARVAATVVGLESDEELARQAERNLTDLGVDNAVVVRGNLRDGQPKQGPYNIIVVNGAVEEVPQGLFDQLADGGRLTTVMRDRPGMGKATIFERYGDAIGRRTMFDAGTPVLPGFHKEKGFVF